MPTMKNDSTGDVQTASLQQHLQKLHLQRERESPPITRKLSPARASPPTSTMTLPVHPEEDTSSHHHHLRETSFQQRQSSSALDVPERSTESPSGRWTDSPNSTTGLSGSPQLTSLAGRSGSPVLNRTLSSSPTSGLIGSPSQHRRGRMGRVSPLVATGRSRSGSQDMEESMDLSSVQFGQPVGSKSDGVLPTGVYGHSMEPSMTRVTNLPSLQGQSGSSLDTIETVGQSGLPTLSQMSVPNPLQQQQENLSAGVGGTVFPITSIQQSVNQNNLSSLLPMTLPSNSSSTSHPSQTIVNSDLLQGGPLASQQQPILSAVPSDQRYPLPNLVPVGPYHLTERGTQFVIDDSDLVQAMEEGSSETTSSSSSSSTTPHHGE